MMTSEPSFILMKPQTLSIIQKIRAFRAEAGVPVYFTLDAGPNVHVIYPKKVKNEVENFIENELKQHCENGRVIMDEMGPGPVFT
jgi:diphosphomevalonate decarboxylase